MVTTPSIVANRCTNAIANHLTSGTHATAVTRGMPMQRTEVPLNLPLPQQSALMTPRNVFTEISPRSAGPERRHDLLVVTRPEMCEAGQEEPFDELPAWIFSCRVTSPLPGNPGKRGNNENPW